MTATDVDDLVTRFRQSRDADKATTVAGAALRRGIVTTLLRHMPADEVATRLGISVTRVNQIKRGSAS